MQMRLLAVFILGASALAAQIGPPAPQGNEKFAKLSEEFIHETLALSPSSASQAGYHQHVDPKTGKTIALDALLDDVSPAGMRGTAPRLRAVARAISHRDPARLARRSRTPPTGS